MAEGAKNFSSVYHSLDSILKFLQKGEFTHSPEVQRLLEIFNSNYEHSDARRDVPHLHPFIVFEGLDGSGKSTNVKRLTNKLNGQKLSTPPSCLLSLREEFDNQPIELRRAYYGLGNYIAGREVEKLVESSPVIMDRFWHSTAACAIADEIRDKNIQLPSEGDPLYNWPSDLTKPDVVLFLEVNESARFIRHKGRNTTNTAEEQLLAQDNLFRENIVEAYKRITGIPVVKINASLYKNRVFKQVEEAVGHLV